MARILIVDDDPDYTEMLESYVAGLGHEVSRAFRLAEGVRVAAAMRPEVVFLDVDLPDGSGLSAIRRIREAPGSPEVIIITGVGDPDGAELAIRSGAWDYLQKGGSLRAVTLPLTRALELRAARERAVPRALDLGELVGRSPAMRACFDLVAQAASSDVSVLVTGPSGTGKELFARAVHANSRRRGGGFVVVDCAALPETLVESVLFGHTRGAFTGATEDRAGLVAQADGGTLFLDEVAELPLSLQKTFLRVLQERRFRPVGARREVGSDFRLVAATNRDLEAMVRAGTFREDLLYRLRGIHLPLPPLADRGKDVREIAQALLPRVCERNQVPPKGVDPGFWDALTTYSWPGNVRELVQALEGAVAAAAGLPTLYATHLPVEVRVHAARAGLGGGGRSGPTGAPEAGYPLLREVQAEATREYLDRLMADAEGDVPTACRMARLSRSRLYALLKEHGVSRGS